MRYNDSEEPRALADVMLELKHKVYVVDTSARTQKLGSAGGELRQEVHVLDVFRIADAFDLEVEERRLLCTQEARSPC